MTLEWRGDDAFDELGTRVASVARFRDSLGDGLTSAWFWNAFVAHEYVLAEGEPGRWQTAAEARSAATTAYADLRERAGGRPVLPPSDARPPPSRWEPLRHGWTAVRDMVSLAFSGSHTRRDDRR